MVVSFNIIQLLSSEKLAELGKCG